MDVFTVRSLGFDISLRHGLLVLGEWDLNEELPKLISYDIIYKWNRGANSLGVRSGPEEIRALSYSIFREVAKRECRGLVMGTDYDPTTAFWGGRLQAQTLAFFCGYVMRTLELRGILPVTLSPKEVRERLHLPPTAHKETIWELFSSLKVRRQAHKDLASDLRDALILSYLVGKGGVSESKAAVQTHLPFE